MLDRRGTDLIGQPAKPWHASEWDGAAPSSVADARGRVLVVRFWTDTCPYCRKSLPALQQLADEFGDRPVSFVGMYHSKPRDTERPWSAAVATARSWGVTLPLAYDRKWQTLDRWWLDGRARVATSVTFVIDPRGRITHVHPGPVFFPSDDPAHAEQNRDFVALRAAIEAALTER